MNKTLKGFLVAGAILSGLVLVGLMIFARISVIRYNMPFTHGRMHGGYPHMTVGAWTPYSWYILGAFALLAVFCILLMVFRSKTGAKLASAEEAKEIAFCPDCGEDVADSWKFCPYCSYDLTLCTEKK